MTQDTQNPADGETAIDRDADSGATPTANPRYVRVMLSVVIGLGVLLVVGTAIVVGTIIKRASSGAPVMAAGEVAPVIPGQVSIPAGAVLQSVENGDTRIVLHLKDGDEILLIMLDPRHGFETGRVRLVSE